MNITKEDNASPIKIWTKSILDVEDSALVQLKNIARLPFIHSNGVAAMPDVHMGVSDAAKPDIIIIFAVN